MLSFSCELGKEAHSATENGNHALNKVKGCKIKIPKKRRDSHARAPAQVRKNSIRDNRPNASKIAVQTGARDAEQSDMQEMLREKRYEIFPELNRAFSNGDLRGKRIFFNGIGGVGMAPLACLLADQGAYVSGCDREEGALISALRARGLSASVPPPPTLPLCDIYCYTQALPEGDALTEEARRRHIPVLLRHELLGAVSAAFSHAVMVAGTHGKSTVTAMAAACLTAGGKSPTVLCGAPLSENGEYYQKGSGTLLLCEACEYKDAFLSLLPTTAVILNCEHDHPDYFPDREAVLASFRRFASRPTVRRVITEDTVTWTYAEGMEDAVGRSAEPTHRKNESSSISDHVNNSTHNTSILAGSGTADDINGGRQSLVFSLSDTRATLYSADVSYDRGFASFIPVYNGVRYPRLALSVPGEHNLKNALAALLIAFSEGVPYAAAREALASFRGAGRRMEKCGFFHGAAVYLDYAHHPTALRAAIGTARQMHDGRVLVLFQSHTYSRTLAFYEAFTEALRCSDACMVFDVFSARETETYGLSGERMARDAGAVYGRSYDDAVRFLSKEAGDGDCILVLGAGDLYRVTEKMKTHRLWHGLKAKK